MSSIILFCNADLTPNVQATIVRQLTIDESITGAEFDARVASDPNYPSNVHQNNLKVLVIRNLSDLTNRTLADAVMFVKAGLASIEANKFGPPGLTLPVDRMYLHEITNGNSPAAFVPNPDAQSNILYPLREDLEEKEIHLAPFGTDVKFDEDHRIGKGAIIPNDDD